MKKRLFTTLLLLCLLTAMLTAAVSAASADYTAYEDGKPIFFTFDANYRCTLHGDNIVTAMSHGSYAVRGIDSWTSDQIVFKIEVNNVYCKGREDGGDVHRAHPYPINEPLTVTFTRENTGEYLCHTKLHLTATITGVVHGWNDALEFTVTSEVPRYTLTKHPPANPTCTNYGYSQLCYECPGCGEFFEDEDATKPLKASDVRLAMTPHNYVNGECTVCHATGEAYTLSPNDIKKYYNTVEAALAAAYEDPDNLSVWITHYPRTAEINLANSCDVHICNGVTIPEITSVSDSQAAININITNHGTIGTISPGSSGVQTLYIVNNGIVNQISIPNNKSLHAEITNNGTITRLVAKTPITLQSGIGTYGWIETAYPEFKLGALLGDGCKFYQSGNNIKWLGSECNTYGTNDLVVTKPPFSVKIMDNHNAELSKDESGGYSLNLNYTAAQSQTLTASLSYPNANTSLSSENAKFTYGWYYASDAAARWSGNVLQLSDLPVGIHQLTLRVTDNKYDYTLSINVTVTITSDDGKQVPVSLQKPDGTFTKMYDGTDKVPENLPINFTVGGKELVLQQVTSDDETAEEKVGYRIVTAAYNSSDCNKATEITVEVALTKAAARLYDLTPGTFTVKGTITKFKPEGTSNFFSLNVSKRTANVGARIMSCLTADNVEFESKYAKTLDPLGASPTITYYRMRSENIYDPTTDEKITENSIFAYEGDYKIYAVVGETENYAELFTECTTLTANSASSSHTHCRYGHKDCTVEDHPLKYTEFKGSSLSPDGTQNQLSHYLNAEKSTVNLTLILRQLRDSSSETPSLDLCLYGKTLRADSEYTDQFRVSNKWHLSLTDCIGTGVLKGTRVDDEYGGCLYVADAKAELYNIKITGGSSSKLGGAIVVGDKGILNIHDGEISGNTVTGGNGGAIYIKSGGTVNIYGGTITNNHVYSGNGGAIYVAAGATLNLYGGKISGNTASGLGGGIYVEKGGELNVQGNPVVTGNTAGGKTGNVYLAGGQILSASKLESGAKIGVGIEALSYPALFAKSTEDYSANFIPDNTDTFVISSNGGLTLAVKPSATLNGTELTVTTGDKYAPDSFVLFAAEYGTDGRLLAVRSQTVEPGKATYTFTVQNPGAKLKCFLLRKDTYTPLFEAFTFN